MAVSIDFRGIVLRKPLRIDAALAGAVAVLALIDLAAEPPPERPTIAIFGALGTTVPIAWRSVAPAASAVLATAAFLLTVTFGTADNQPTVTTFAPLISLFALGENGSARALIRAGVPCVIAWSSAGLFNGDVGTSVFGLGLSTGAIAVGRAARVMGVETEMLEAQLGSLREEQEQRERAALAAERERIARELHDVIGHSISVMGIQAGAVRRVLPAELARERGMLEDIERSGRDSVGEMRRLIDLLRTPDDTPNAAPPTLLRVQALAEEVRRAGLDIELELEGNLADVPPGRALAGYRIVQEALTNALKHAPGAVAIVRIRRLTDSVSIDVSSGPDPVGAVTPGGGNGLIGMRERAALYGGRLEAGPTADGGFRVSATLPDGDS